MKNNKFKIVPLLTVGYLGLTALNVVAQDRPNILYIMSDDHTAQAISAYHGILSTVFQTPNIDRIANEGIRLDNCFVTNSISTPSRAAIITGQYSQKNGVYTLNDALDPAAPNAAKYMQASGYQTAIVGKWHLHAEPTGFDWYNIFPGQGRYFDPELIEKGTWGNDPRKDVKQGKVHKGHSTDVIAGEALHFLKNRDQNKPFFLMCHFKAPHGQWEPAKRFEQLLKDVHMPEPANMLDEYKGKGEYMQTIHNHLENLHEKHLHLDKIPEGMTRMERRKWAYQIWIKNYLRCIAGVDENVGKILDYVDAKGLTENTVVIYTGDQGFYLGEHGWYDKRMMYEESLHMPFLVRYPKEIKPAGINKDITLNVDIAPLFLDYAEVKKPSQMQGESFRSNMRGNTPSNWRTSMYYRYWMQSDKYHNMVAHYGIRTQRYKLIYFYAKGLDKTGTNEWKSCKEQFPVKTSENLKPYWELYDLLKDPMEMNNLYNNPTQKPLVNRLKHELLDLKKQYQDEDDHYPVMQDLNTNYFWK